MAILIRCEGLSAVERIGWRRKIITRGICWHGKKKENDKGREPEGMAVFGALSLLILNSCFGPSLDVLQMLQASPTGAVVARFRQRIRLAQSLAVVSGRKLYASTQTSATTPTNIAVPPQCLQETDAIVSD